MKNVILKGRQVGKSSMLPKSTAIGATIQQQNSRSSLDTVIRREILPGLIFDIKGADQFKWTWRGFYNSMSGAVGTVVCHCGPPEESRISSFVISRDVIDRALANASNSYQLSCLIAEIDHQIGQAMHKVMSTFLPPHDTATCTDPECYC